MEHRKNAKGNNVDIKSGERSAKTLPILALVISICALTASIVQIVTNRKQYQLSVMPRINITPYLEGPGGKNGLYIENVGLGPAFIKSMKITVNGNLYEGLERSQWGGVMREAGLNYSCFMQGWTMQLGLVIHKY